jgi:isoquinoline 1-oxidoreductase subunit alpha
MCRKRSSLTKRFLQRRPEALSARGMSAEVRRAGLVAAAAALADAVTRSWTASIAQATDTASIGQRGLSRKTSALMRRPGADRRLAASARLEAMATIRINGAERTVDIEDDIPLLWVLRDELRLTGTKYGCGIAQCGACTVHVDGRATRSCVTPAAALQGRDVVTIEGVSGNVARAVQDTWRRLDVAQCGYCQSGQIMSAIALLSEIRRPSDADIDAAMSGNVCRCATYVRIRAAIHEAAKTLGA